MGTACGSDEFVRTRSDKRGHAQTHTHTQTMDRKGERKRASLFFACVKVSQGGDEHIQRSATQSTNLLVLLSESGDKVFFADDI